MTAGERLTRYAARRGRQHRIERGHEPAPLTPRGNRAIHLLGRLDDVNAGKGTVGKLLKSDELANQLKTTIGRIDLILDKINSGQGTIGQLLVNSTLYDNLSGATRELHALMKDFRANPKKFLTIQLKLW